MTNGGDLYDLAKVINQPWSYPIRAHSRGDGNEHNRSETIFDSITRQVAQVLNLSRWHEAATQ